MDRLKELTCKLDQIYADSRELNLDISKLQLRDPIKHTHHSRKIKIFSFYLNDDYVNMQCNTMTHTLSQLFHFFNVENRFFYHEDWAKYKGLGEHIDKSPGSQSAAVVCFPKLDDMYFLLNEMCTIIDKFCKNTELTINLNKGSVSLKRIAIEGGEHDCEQSLSKKKSMN